MVPPRVRVSSKKARIQPDQDPDAQHVRQVAPNASQTAELRTNLQVASII
jgi:hypothetical protein